MKFSSYITLHALALSTNKTAKHPGFRGLFGHIKYKSVCLHIRKQWIKLNEPVKTADWRTFMKNHSLDDHGSNDATKEKINIKKEILEWIQIIVAAAAIALFLNSFIIANSRIPSASMEDTIMTGDRVIGSRLSYLFSEPQRGDIIIFRYPLDEKIYYVKRLIGLPGDTVDIIDGKVYINGSDEPLNEPYLKEEMEPEPSMHFEVPEDCYFFLGDNRNNSLDARYWEMLAMRSPDTDSEHDYTFVARDKLVAKVIFRYYPHPGLIK